MSGTGRNNFAAPTRLTPPAGDQPIGNTPDGTPVRSTMYLLQFLQRLLSYIGQPTAANTSGASLSSQIGLLNVTTTISESIAAAANARLNVSPPLPTPLPPLPVSQAGSLTPGEIEAMIWFET